MSLGEVHIFDGEEVVLVEITEGLWSYEVLGHDGTALDRDDAIFYAGLHVHRLRLIDRLKKHPT